MSHLRPSASLLSLILTFIIAIHPAAAQSPSGAVTGRVVDAATSQPLPGARVGVGGLVMTAVTDRDGNFRLAGVPVGRQDLTITYLGHTPATVSVTIASGGTATLDVKLARSGYEEAVVVTLLVADAQARALNQQRTAPNITNIISADQIGHFPDPNAAEVLQRVPGLSIQRDQGEGRYVIVRGTEPRLNSMMIDGERIPAPEADVRQVALDVIPADLLQAVEVSKALTPDMDADAIGGAVNLVMKQAPTNAALFGSIGGGYNSSLGSGDQHNASVTLGRRFAQNKVGAVFSASSTGTTRGNQDFEPVYTSGNLTDLDLRDYTVHRGRNGATGAVDFRAAATSQLTFRGVYNRFIDDHEERQRWRNRVANRRLERELRDRTHLEHIWSASLAGVQDFGRATLEYHIQQAHSDQRDPGTITSTFRQSNVNFSPNVTPMSIDPDNVQANPLNENLDAYTFNSQVRAINNNDDRDIVGGADIKYMATSSTRLTALLKGGFKVRDKNKERTRDEVTLTSPTAITLASVLQPGGASYDLLDGRYQFGPFIDMAAVSALPDRVAMNSAVNHARDAEDSTTGENVTAGYGMVELFVGPRFYVLPGVRVEHTSSDYVGYDVQFAPNGAWVSSTPIAGSNSYTNVLPGVNVRYAVTDDTNLRVAFTRTLARPNYISLIPSRTFDDSANTITIGNAGLKPTLSWNFDVMAERYLKSIGVISGGFFYKNLKDYIYTFTSNEIINNETFTVTQPLNGQAASIVGLELVAQSQLDFLPRALHGIGLYANYTFTDSNAEFPGRTGEQSTLPGQSRHVGNFAVSYERSGFTGRVAANFHGAYVDQVASVSGLDRFYDTHTQVDISLSQRIHKFILGYVNFLNLSDAPLRYFQGVSDRPLQEEHYQWWMDFGVKINWSRK